MTKIRERITVLICIALSLLMLLALFSCEDGGGSSSDDEPDSFESVQGSNETSGTTDTSVGTTDSSVGTTDSSTGTTDTSVGTTDSSTGTTDTSVGTTDTSVGTTDTSVGTTDTSVGTIDTSVGTTDSSNTTESSDTTESSGDEKPDVPSVPEYTVSFDSNGGTAVESQVVEKGEKAKAPKAPTRPGYTFDGWYMGEEKWSFIGYVVTEEMTLVAKWTPNENTIIFDANSGEGSMENITVATESKVNLTANAFTKVGYTFLGWSTTKDGEVEFVDGAEYTMGTESTYTLYAVWEVNENTLVFNANGGEGTMDNMTVCTDSTVNLTANVFTKAGYYFVGWSTTSDGEVEYTNGAEYTMGTSASYTLYAIWEANENTLVFNANSGEGTMENMTVATDSTANLTTNVFTRAGYHFMGWSTTEDGEVDYTDGAEYTMGTESTYTLYAVWEANENTLVFNANSGEGTMDNMTVATDSTANLTTNVFTRLGYTFIGWSTTEDGEVEFADGAEYTMGTDSSYTLYAVWEAIEYTITYVHATTPNNPSKCTIADVIILQDATDSKGYNAFAGWYTDANFENRITEIKNSTGNVTLYAKWLTNAAALSFTKSGSSYSVTGCVKDIDVVVIPSTYNGLPVTSIGNYAFEYCTSLTSVTIPDSVTSIGSSAFRDCTSLTSVTIPEGVTSIGYRAFYDCDSLTSVTIPDSVTTIGSYAFYKCTSLTSITIPEGVTSIGSSVFEDCTSLTSVTTGNSVTTIGSSAFNKCTSLTSITIPDSVTTIDSSAFCKCTSLTSITIPDSVTSIGNGAFAYCTSLTSITVDENNESYKSIDGNLYTKDGKTLIQYAIGKDDTSFVIPEGVTSIGSSAFYKCTSLTSITIGEGVTSIGSSAFEDCASLTSITIPDSVTTIGESAFYDCDSLTSITIGDSVTSIGSYAFSHCTSLTSITIPNSVTTIGSSAFSHCTSLTSITIPEGVTRIGDDAFYDCDSLTSITIGNSVTTIGSSAFYDCDSLTSVTIGNSVTTIGSYAFYSCNNLTSVTIGNSVTSIGNGAFHYCYGLTSVTIPDSVTTIGSSAFSNCDSLTIYCEASSKPSGWDSDWKYSNCPVVWNCNNNDVASDGYIYTVIDGVRYALKNSEATVVRQPHKITTANIPSSITYKGQVYSVTTIGSSAFYDCDSLTSVTIGNSVTTIGSSAFHYCTSLTSVTIGNSVTTIGSSAFHYCTSLISVTIGNSVTTIGSSAFEGCSSLTSITIPEGVTSIGSSAFYDCDSLTIITIPDSVTSIGGSAFEGCTSLISITIGNSVTSIGNNAFSDCTSLTSITIPDSVTSIGDYAFYNCRSLTIYCEASSEPSGWYYQWNSSNCPVQWGHTHSYTDGECICGAKEG